RWNPCSLMYRRHVVDELGGYLPNLLGGDCEFAARIETRWGVNSHLMLKKPLMIGWQRGGSLSNLFRKPVVHGDSSSADSHFRRLQDWETWRKAHIKFFENRHSYKNFDP